MPLPRPPGRRVARLGPFRTAAAILWMGAAATVPATALDLAPEHDDGYLPVLAASPADAHRIDARRTPLRPDPDLPAPPEDARLPRTPGEIALAQRQRARVAAEGLGAFLLARRPDLLRVRFGRLAPDRGQDVALPFEVSVDPEAYARFADEFVQRVRAFTGASDTEVDMPVHAEFLANGRLRLGAPWTVDDPRRPPADDGAGAGPRARPFEGGMTLLVCTSWAPAATRGVWRGEPDPVAHYAARWRVFELDADTMRALVDLAATRHRFHVRVRLCDAEGRAVALPPRRVDTPEAPDGLFPVDGLFGSPEPGFLVVMPWLQDPGREAVELDDTPARPGFSPAADSEIPPEATRAPWRRVARFDAPDALLETVAIFRARYGTGCFPADADHAACPVHPPATDPSGAR